MEADGTNRSMREIVGMLTDWVLCLPTRNLTGTAVGPGFAPADSACVVEGAKRVPHSGAGIRWLYQAWTPEETLPVR